MHQKLIIIVLLLVTALLSFHLFAYLARWRGRDRSAGLMALLMGASGWWALFNAAEYLASSFGMKLVFANVQYAAIAAIPALWFAFGRAYLAKGGPAARTSTTALIWVLPALTAVLVWLDPLTGLVRSSLGLVGEGSSALLAKRYGPWFWVHSAYSYALVMTGTLLIIRAAGRGQERDRPQFLALVAGALLPLCANALYLSGLSWLGGVDPTPIAFMLTGLLFLLSLSRYRLLIGIEAARARLVDQLRDPVVVADRSGHVAYANAAACRELGLGDHPEGRSIAELSAPFSALAGLRGNGEVELRVPQVGGGERRYEARAGSFGRAGQVVILFDVTRRVQAEEALKEANLLLEGRILEWTQAIEDSNARHSKELDHRVRIERQLTYEALHDPLTGLANRSLLLNRIEQAIVRCARDPANDLGLLYIDFDGFKAVNDAYGHEAGDVFLREMALRFRKSVREVDTVARLGGDEFVLLLDEPGGRDGIARAAERVIEDLAVPVQLGRGSVVPAASIGLLLGGSSYATANDVLLDADIAMYQAKARGRNRSVFFEPEMRRSEAERNKLMTGLRAAISSGGISLAYQPIVRIQGGLAGWEVLARWPSLEFGEVGPTRFIPLAEESGLIVPLGTFVLLTALKRAAAMRDLGLIDAREGSSPFFSVNVSAIQLGNPDFAELVLEAIDHAGLPRSILHLEVTESCLMEGNSTATSVVARLAGEGISFKIDDFGMGYSSLSSLRGMPIDTVKIDKSFVERLSNGGAGLVRGIISLAHELGKTVVAEGVESPEHDEALASYGCDFGQGWLYGRPLESPALGAALRREPGPATRG
jgi:diguanylate cyclase (GGDEF)-like protein